MMEIIKVLKNITPNILLIIIWVLAGLLISGFKFFQKNMDAIKRDLNDIKERVEKIESSVDKIDERSDTIKDLIFTFVQEMNRNLGTYLNFLKKRNDE